MPVWPHGQAGVKRPTSTGSKVKSERYEAARPVPGGLHEAGGNTGPR